MIETIVVVTVGTLVFLKLIAAKRESVYLESLNEMQLVYKMRTKRWQETINKLQEIKKAESEKAERIASARIERLMVLVVRITREMAPES